MKILQICPDFEPYVRGGGTMTYKLLAQAWKMQGHEVTTAASVPARIAHQIEATAFPFRLEFFKLISLPAIVEEASYYSPLTPHELIRFRKFLMTATRENDLVVIHGLMEGISLASILSLKSFDRVVLTHHGVSTAAYSRGMRWISKVLYKSIGKIAVSRAKKVFIYSERSEEEFVEYFGRQSSISILTTPSGMDVSKLSNDFQAAIQSSDALHNWLVDALGVRGPFLFAIGRNVRTKGFDLLIESFKRITEKYPALSLIIGGDQTDYTSFLKQLSDENGVSNRVVFAGRITDVQKVFLMTQCNCFVISSRKEGYGLNAAEAAILQTPTVATKTGAHESILADSTDSRLAETDSEASLTESILEVLSTYHSPTCFNRDIAARFDINSLAAKYLKEV